MLQCAALKPHGCGSLHVEPQPNSTFEVDLNQLRQDQDTACRPRLSRPLLYFLLPLLQLRNLAEIVRLSKWTTAPSLTMLTNSGWRQVTPELEHNGQTSKYKRASLSNEKQKDAAPPPSHNDGAASLHMPQRHAQSKHHREKRGELLTWTNSGHRLP